MGITFSTQNYEKIINLIEEPYMNNLQVINKNLAEAVNIDNNNRKLVYKHRTKEIYLLYCGGICNVSQCFEVNENFLLRQSDQFGSFHSLKNHILTNYPKSELVMEIVKYESENYIDIIDILEKGECNEVLIDFNFTDTETESESESDSGSEYPDSFNEDIETPPEVNKNTETTPINDIYSIDWCADWNAGWGADWEYDSNSFSNNIISNWEYNYGDFCCPVKACEGYNCFDNSPDKVFEDFFPYTSLFNTSDVPTLSCPNESVIHSNNIIKNMDGILLTTFTKQALDAAKSAAEYANDVATECMKDIKSIHMYNQNYLDIIEEDLGHYDSDEDSDDIIAPNMNYFKTFD